MVHVAVRLDMAALRKEDELYNSGGGGVGRFTAKHIEDALALEGPVGQPMGLRLFKRTFFWGLSAMCI